MFVARAATAASNWATSLPVSSKTWPKLPMPEPVYFDGQRLPASYANFYVGNAAVLVPTFKYREDVRALGILSELFRDRPVIGVFCRDLVLGLGTIHCSTQQEPSGK
jgi:agmatine deiminase